MPNDVFVPESEPLKHLVRQPRSWIATKYLWLSLLVHSIVVLRGLYILIVEIYGRHLSFGAWESHQPVYFVWSIGSIVLIMLTLHRFWNTFFVYASNLCYLIYQLITRSTSDIIGGSSADYIFWGRSGEFFWLWMLFIVVTLVIFPLVIGIVTLIRRFKS